MIEIIFAASIGFVIGFALASFLEFKLLRKIALDIKAKP